MYDTSSTHEVTAASGVSWRLRRAGSSSWSGTAGVLASGIPTRLELLTSGQLCFLFVIFLASRSPGNLFVSAAGSILLPGPIRQENPLENSGAARGCQEKKKKERKHKLRSIIFFFFCSLIAFCLHRYVYKQKERNDLESSLDNSFLCILRCSDKLPPSSFSLCLSIYLFSCYPVFVVRKKKERALLGSLKWIDTKYLKVDSLGAPSTTWTSGTRSRDVTADKVFMALFGSGWPRHTRSAE